VYFAGGHAVSKCALLHFIYVIDLGDHLLHVEVYSHKQKHIIGIALILCYFHRIYLNTRHVEEFHTTNLDLSKLCI
jgi:hypothetical protein